MTRSMEGLWKNSAAHTRDDGVPQIERVDEAALSRRLRRALRSVIDWFVEY